MTENKLNQRIKSLASKKLQMPAAPPKAKKPPLAPKDREVRQDAYKFGEIRCAGGETQACVFLDLSDTGARIRLHCATTLPTRVRVVIPSTGFGRDAEVRWQTGAEAGLQFVDGVAE